MAAALVGGAFLSSFVNVLFDSLSSPEVVNWIKGKKLDEKLLGRLKTILSVVEAVLDDAEQKQITNPGVKKWLADLQDAVYKADDLIDEVSTKAATQKDPGNIWPRFFNSQDREMVSKIEEVIGTLKALADHKDILRLENIKNENMSGKIPSTSLLVEKSKIYGRDKEKDDIIGLLLKDTGDSKISVVPIVGMGGIGKTTLAQLVYNDDKLKGKFDCEAWVCVSEQVDMVKITKTITAAVTGNPCDENDLNILQNDLKKELSGKKFLIVLDDMWIDCSEKWGILSLPFQYGNKGSKILVTTRNDKVARVVQPSHSYVLDLLSEEDCWSIFVKHAFVSTESEEYLTLEETGKKIVTKCNILPLAVKALGSLLRSNYEVNYWDSISKSEIWQLEDERRIIPSLRISYHYLLSYLKRCFVYCSLYPKGYEFDKDDLILLWMGENLLILPKRKTTLEDIGCDYFKELVARSFFLPSSATEGLFVMHDLMHDLATSCAGEFYFRDELENEIEIDKVCIKTRHLSHNAMNNYPISKLLTACDRVKHSRTFLEINLWRVYPPSKMEHDPCILLSHLKCLRVLSFKSFALDSLPNSIVELVHMRYLDLSNTSIVRLPEQLTKLYNLQTLKLNGCDMLEMLPSDMQDFVNLRHLDIRGTKLKEMPKAMSKLKHLQFLSNYFVGKDEENKIRELGLLAALHRSLVISNLENLVNSDEASEARIIDKKYINSLVLRWFSNSSVADSRMEREILNKLQPHSNLKKLSIHGYRGTTLSDWLGHSSYKNMTNLILRGCKNCCMLPSLGQLSSLKHIEISYFDELVSIGAEFYKSDESCWETPFRSLETLEFDGLDRWQEWRSLEFDDAFPQLKELTIKRCPMLIRDLPNHLPALEKLTIEWGCEQLACSLPRAPAMLELTIKSKNKLRMQELPLSLSSLSIQGNQLVEFVFEAMTHTQPTCLRELNISGCDSALSFPGDCLPSSLQVLSIKGCKKLDFPMQQHQSLRSLAISDSCDSLTSFPLHAFPNLTNLYISGCGNLKSFVVVSQSPKAAISSLRSLTISYCPKFVSFSALWMAAPQLGYLDISDCPEIDSFPEGGLLPNLRHFDIRKCEKLLSCLASMDLRSLGLTRLGIGNLSESVKSFPKESWLPTSLEELYLWHSRSVETLDCNGLTHLTSIQHLIIQGSDKLENMTGERLPASLTDLVIYDCPLLGERCRVKDPQIWPKISHIPHIEVDSKKIS